MEHFLKKTTSVQSAMNNSTTSTNHNSNASAATANTTKTSPLRNLMYSNFQQAKRPSLKASASCNPISQPSDSIKPQKPAEEEEKISVPELPATRASENSVVQVSPPENSASENLAPKAETPTKDGEAPEISAAIIPAVDVGENDEEEEGDCAKVDFDDEESESDHIDLEQSDELYKSCLEEQTRDDTKPDEEFYTPENKVENTEEELPQASSTPKGPTEESPPEIPRRKPTVKLTEDEFTKVYQERNPLERLAKLNSLKRKQSSLVHDIIINKGNSANRASNRLRTRAPISPNMAVPPPVPPLPQDKVIKPPIPKVTNPELPSSSKRTPDQKQTLSLDFPLIDAEPDSPSPASPERVPTALKLPATPITDPAKFGIPVPRNSTRTANHKQTSSSKAPMVSPDNDLSASDTTAPNSPSKKSNFMKTISGIFNHKSGAGGGKISGAESPEERKSRSDTFIRFARGLRSSSAVKSPEKKRHPTSFRTGSLTMRATHPSTPPVPLSRKITIKTNFGSSDESLSDDDGEDPTIAAAADSSLVNELKKEPRPSSLPPEILDKLMRRGGKNAARSMKVAQLKRIRKAQEIQRQLEEIDVKHKELEEKGIIAERSLRGEEDIDVEEGGQYDSDLMQTWFRLLAEKNALIRQEQELLVKAKHLELEDRSAKLEMELREHHLLRDSQDVVKEGDILKELLEISEQREMLQSMLAKDKKRYQQEDLNIERQMKAKGFFNK